jgi:hypothetical protein
MSERDSDLTVAKISAMAVVVAAALTAVTNIVVALIRWRAAQLRASEESASN